MKDSKSPFEKIKEECPKKKVVKINGHCKKSVLDIEDYIKTNFQFLLNQGFTFDMRIEESIFSSIILASRASELLFCFTSEKGMLSVSITSSKILDNDKYDCYSKYYDMFYVSKLLNPNLKFSDINYLLYPVLIKDHWDSIINLFNEEVLDENIKKLNEIARCYDKIRWSANSTVKSK